jgi:tetratricopeptide (TPR) repeat protein
MKIRFRNLFEPPPISLDRAVSGPTPTGTGRIKERSRRRRRSNASCVGVVGERNPEGSAREDHRVVLRGYCLLVLAIVAPALGGSAEVWAQGVLALGVAGILLLFPPEQSLGRWLNLIFVALAALPLTAFLPSRWTGVPAWQSGLPADFPTSLGSLRTPQPWITAQAVLTHWLVLSVVYLALSHCWSAATRPKVIGLYIFGIFAITVAYLGAFWTRGHIPFWPAESEFFGFFPNRNHTSQVMAMAGIMMCATAVEAFRRGHAIGALWLMPLPVMLYALICNYSRAGIILFFVGILAFLIWNACHSRPRRPAIIGLNVILVLFGLFFVFGGKTLQRFGSETLAPFSAGKDFRVQVHRDAMALSMKSPLLGIGLQNFGSVFQMARTASASQYLAVQPESDWLWTAVELGWVAPVLLCWGGVLYLRRCLPLERGTHPGLRMAAIVTALAFAVHSIYEVAGHFLGAVIPAVFLASTAIHPRDRGYASAWMRPFFRLIGGVMALAGVWWLASAVGATFFPTTRTVEVLKRQIQLASGQQDFDQVISKSNDLLRLAPLDAEAHFDLAQAYALTERRREADAAFDAARGLRPVWVDLCIREGNFWYGLGDWSRCRVGWDAALRRDLSGAPQLYSGLLGETSGNKEVRETLRQWARRGPEMFLTFFNQANPAEFKSELDELLNSDPELAGFHSDQLVRLFEVWARLGDQSRLSMEIRKHPAWEVIGWRWLVKEYVVKRNFELAYRTALPHVTVPRLPSVGSGSLTEIRRRWTLFPDDFAAAFQVYSGEAATGGYDDALTTLWKVTAITDCPVYFHYLKAQILARSERWEEAWSALNAYAPDLDQL